WSERVTCRGRIAEVPAHARPALNLPAADDLRRIGESGIVSSEILVFVNLITRDSRAKPQAFGVRIKALSQFGNALDVDHQVRLTKVFAKLDDEIGSTGEDSDRAAT